jgi:hypothetical protein
MKNPVTMDFLSTAAEQFENDAQEKTLLAETLNETDPATARMTRRSADKDLAAANELWQFVDALKGIAEGQRVDETIASLIQLSDRYRRFAATKLAKYRRMVGGPNGASQMYHDAHHDGQIAQAYRNMAARLDDYRR